VTEVTLTCLHCERFFPFHM